MSVSTPPDAVAVASPPAADDPAAPSASALPATAAAGVTLFVCTSCRGPDGADALPRPGELLLDAVRAVPDAAIRIAGAECLGNCNRRLSAAMVADCGWTYVFGDLAPDDAAALVQGGKLLAASAGGPLPWRGRPERLKRGLIARVPPLPRPGDDR